MNFTLPNAVKGWTIMFALILTVSSFTHLNAQCVLAMNDLVAISLSDNDCTATLNEDMFLESPQSCPVPTVAHHFEFEVRSADGQTVIEPRAQNVVLDYTNIGGPYMITLWAVNANGVTINVAMGAFTVLDKMPPLMDCPEGIVDIYCWQQDTYSPTATDNCSPADITITKIDHVITDNNCVDDLMVNVFRVIERTYIAKDKSGNLSQPCTVTMHVNRMTPIQFNTWIKFPVDLVKAHENAISCENKDYYKDQNGKFNPHKTGWPYLVYPDERPTAWELAHEPLVTLPGQTVARTIDTILLKNDCVLACNLASTYLDVNINSCPECVEKVVRFWTVVESSCQYPERFRTNIQTIEVTDTIPPVIICPDNKTITTNTIGNFAPTTFGDADCGARFTFPVPVITDLCCNCVKWTISVTNDLGIPIMFADTAMTKKPVKRDLPLGENLVTYTAYDKCGNSASCTWTVTVVDNTPPVAICQQFTTVSLTYDGEAEIAAINFNSGSYDDCLIDKFEVRRMDNKINCNGDVDLNPDHFFPYVTFCCSDVGGANEMVIMRVWDKSGNWNDCMVQVAVQDKLPPQITCPPDLCVECEYSFDITKMENYFGTVVEGEDNRETHSIGGKWGAFYHYYNSDNNYCEEPIKNLKFQDGWAHDNCGLRIEPSYVDNRNQCGEGNVVREFVASDPNGSVKCKQYIHFYNPEPFDRDDITWPKDITITGCNDEALYGPDVTGWPILAEDACDLVAANYSDLVYHFNDDDYDANEVCFKIIRRWTVMDWCQKYTEGPYQGQFKTWHWDQVIMISETEDPVFTSTCEDKEACTYDSECKEGYIELTMSSRDNCTKDEDMKWRYQIDYYNDGKDNTKDGINNGSFDIDSKSFTFPNNIISGPSANASGTYPIGKHRIVWTTWDQCGNKITCDKYFTIKNCKKPTPICVDHIVVEMMPVDTDNNGVPDWAMIELPANCVEDCCSKSFHPCGYPITYSWSSDVKDIKRTFDCTDKGIQTVQMWVTAHLPDGTITQDYCVTRIDFQDNNRVCPQVTGNMVNVKGAVTTVNNLPITNVNIAVQGSELGPQTTNNNGAYEFSVESQREYVMTPDKDGDDLNGVSTLDLVLIQKHILGLKPITNPYLMLAANANSDNKVSASDILALRKLILGESSDIGKSWRFMPKNYQFINPLNPYGETVPVSANINPKEDATVDFYGIKIGDMNLSLIESRSSENLVFAIDAQNIVPGEVAVPVYAENINAAEGFQFTIQYDNDVLSFNEIESVALKSLSNSNIGLSKSDNGIITVSWNKEGQETISNEEPLFVLKFNANKAANLQNTLTFNSSVLKKEAYNAELEIMGIELNYRNAGNEFTLYQNTPNPFSEFTDINFFLTENTKGTLTINDLSGKVVMIKEGEFTKGLNTIRINKSELNVSGVMYYRLETEGNTATKKMILIK
jgi:hypothetical protein